MKKQITRILAVCLVFALCLMPMAGCKNSNGEWISEVYYDSEPQGTSNTDTDTSKGEKDADGGKTTASKSNGKTATQKTTGTTKVPTAGNVKNPLSADLGGRTINVFAVSDFTDVKAGSSKAAAAQASMVKKLEEKLNCKVSVTTYDPQQLYQQVLLNVASGTYFADIIMAPIYTTVGYISSDFTKDLSKITTVDLSQSYMNVCNSIDSFQFGTGVYALADPLENSSCSNFLFMNKRILKEVTGSENYVYDLMSKKQWNIANFRDLCKKATKDLDGVSGLTTADRGGLLQLDIGTNGYSAVLEACGADMVKKSNGKVSYNMQSEEVLNAMNLSYDIFVKDGTCIGAGDSDACNLFRTGHGLFFGGGYLSLLPLIADMDDDFGIVPFPTENGDKYSMAINWNFATMMIPSNLDDEQAKAAGSFLQAYYYLSNSVVKVKYNEYESRYLCDKQSRENLDLIYKSMRVTPASVVGNSSLADIFNGTYKICHLASGGEDVSTAIQSTAKAAKSGVDELNKKFK